MTSSRSSNLFALALLVTTVVATAAPVAAVSVGESTIPAEAEAGTQVSATVTLTDLYQSPQWEPWTLRGETQLANVTWTVTFINAQGDEFDTRSYDGQTFSQANISTAGEDPIIDLRITVTGEVPTPAEWTYPEEETFVVMDLTQTRGQQGSRNDITTREVHHYTTGEADTPGSQQARAALNGARTAIEEARAADADTARAENTLASAVNSYRSGNFENAVSLATRAQEEANTALENKQSSEQQSQLLMIGGGVLLVVLLAGGGFWWYRNQQRDSYDKLG